MNSVKNGLRERGERREDSEENQDGRFSTAFCHV